MQNFWWNKTFRQERKESETLAAVTALSKAQTALEGLLSSHGSLLSQHTSLLSDLTVIAEALQEELQAVSVECDNIGSELVMLENNDNALSARIDGIEEACADTAAEQSTRLEALETAVKALQEVVR